MIQHAYPTMNNSCLTTLNETQNKPKHDENQTQHQNQNHPEQQTESYFLCYWDMEAFSFGRSGNTPSAIYSWLHADGCCCASFIQIKLNDYY